MNDLNRLKIRVKKLNELKRNMELSENTEYLESLNWAIKVCQREYNRKYSAHYMGEWWK